MHILYTLFIQSYNLKLMKILNKLKQLSALGSVFLCGYAYANNQSSWYFVPMTIMIVLWSLIEEK